MGKGCAGYICVGDKVYVQDGDGYVEAVNAITQKISVNFAQGASRYSGLATYGLRSITSVGKGCVYGYCVGDTAVVSDGDGIIVGVDPIMNKATVDFTRGRSRYSGVATYELSQISINAYCLDISGQDPRRSVQTEAEYSYYFSPR